MPFDRPTLRTLIDRFKQDIRTYTEGGDALLRRSVEKVLSRAVPGLTHGLYGYLAWAAEQLFPDKCDDENVLRWASIYGLSLKPAAKAICVSATFDTTGPTIPVGSVVRRADGVQYEVTSEAVAAGVVTVALRALVAGAAGNADPVPTIELTLVAPIPGVNSVGAVTDPDGIHDGVDMETVEALRGRLLQRIANPPRGGAPGDYEGWALEVAGVTRVWVTPRVQGAGTVGVQFVTDAPDNIASPIPTDGKVDQVQQYLVERAPVTIGRSIGGEWVGVVTTKPIALPLTIEIADLDPDTPAIREAIAAEVRDFLRREAQPGKADGSVVLYRSRLDEAISSADGEFSHRLVQPAADIVPGQDELPILTSGTIIWS